MKKTLQDQYLLIKEGKGHVGVFLTEAKRQFPNIVRNAATFDEAVASLKTKNIISENVISVMPAIMDRPKKESYETAFEAFLAEAKKKENEDEKVKAEEKKVSKPVEKDLEHNYDYSDEKNPDNMIFDQIMTGYYAEMKDPKNADKTMQQLKDIVFKNLAKDPIYYTKNGQFGIKDLGYTMDVPGLGEPKEAKGKYKSSGYGDLKESKETEDDLKSKLINMGVSPMVVDSIAKSKGIEGLKDRLKEKLKEGEVEYYDGDEEEEVKDVRDMSWTKGFTKEEQTLREVIREMIDAELEEAYQLVNINPVKSDKERNERDPQPFKTTYIDPEVIDSLRKNQHLRILRSPSNPEEIAGIAIRARLIPTSSKNLGKTTDNLGKLGIDIPSDLKNYLTDTNNIGGEKQLPTKEGVAELYKLLNNATLNQNGSLVIKVPNPNYVKEGVLGVRDNDVNYNPPLSLPVSYSDDKNVAHYSDDDRYSSQEDRLDVEDYFEQIQGMSDGDAFDYLGELGLERDEILTVLKSRKSSLRESVEKDLADINKEAEHEVLQAKLDKIDALIDHRRSKLGKLDEDEDMKALTDKKKVKELEKDIKKLEVARKKIEKMMSKFKGKKAASKEVIDEDETPIEASEEYLQYKEDAERRYDEGEDIDSIIDTYTNISLDMKNMLRDDLEGKADGMDY